MTILEHVRIVDVREGVIREGHVAVEGGRIQSLGARRGTGSDSIELDGAFLLPGLVSCHTHFSIVFPFSETDPNETPAVTAFRAQKRAVETLRAGITTVRTVGEKHRIDITMRAMAKKGWATAPRILAAGRSISTTGGHGSGFGSIEADGADEFRKAARQELAAGADHIKIFITGGIAHRGESFVEPQTSVAEMEAAVAVANSKNTYVTAHAGGSEPIQKAIKAGLRCFEHGYQIDRATARALHGAGAYLVPTLGVTRSPDWMKANRFEQWTIDKALAAGTDHLDSIRFAIAAGVKLVNGTDIPPGDTDGGVTVAVREMEHMVAAGLSPLEALRATTLRAAELLRLDREIGAVEPGYAADLVAVRSNPLDDVAAMRAIHFVMQDGRVIRREQA
jgi:imidazolonepropionase-like amidohydrolase